MQGPIKSGWDTLFTWFINFDILVQVKNVLMQASCKITMGHSSSYYNKWTNYLKKVLNEIFNRNYMQYYCSFCLPVHQHSVIAIRTNLDRMFYHCISRTQPMCITHAPKLDKFPLKMECPIINKHFSVNRLSVTSYRHHLIQRPTPTQGTNS